MKILQVRMVRPQLLKQNHGINFGEERVEKPRKDGQEDTDANV